VARARQGWSNRLLPPCYQLSRIRRYPGHRTQGQVAEISGSRASGIFLVLLSLPPDGIVISRPSVRPRPPAPMAVEYPSSLSDPAPLHPRTDGREFASTLHPAVLIRGFQETAISLPQSTRSQNFFCSKAESERGQTFPSTGPQHKDRSRTPTHSRQIADCVDVSA